MDYRGTASRPELVTAIRERLRRVGLPRFQMLILVMLTGLLGFLASVVLLHWKLRTMWLRYGIAVAFAYLMFLLLLRLWIHKRSWFAPDVGDILERLGSPNASEASAASWPSERGPLDWLDICDVFNLDLEEFAMTAFLVVVASALIVCIYVVYSSPTLFAEILVDGAFSAGLYRRTRDLEPRHWLGSVLRLTGVPFAFVAMFCMVAGGVSQTYAPEAVSIGGVLRHCLEQVQPQHPSIAPIGSRSE